ncbi:hypothetical protein [Flavobacterium sp. ov086]|uniref:hypothetical protein n=1 Tax=Flavobacterium sp. ov086 TaxID=1761785 RepID=UPI000B6BEED5|nr:hypothetical protein [Flavobacterium sp. ov086]SNR65849.1 hypothetical protein SAMN04487979_115113 [Flavobacterium sp. ov086]
MKKQNIEDIFSSMEDFSSVPPPELWGQIEEKLDQPKKKKRAILWWSAAACLLLGLLLPSVLHFTSDSGIKNLNNGASGTNKVVIEEKTEKNKNNLNDSTISTPENKILKEGFEKNQTKENLVENNKVKEKSNTSKGDSSSSKKAIKPSVTIYQKPETAVAHVDSENKTNNNSTHKKSNIEKRNTNQAVAEQTFITGKKDSFNSVSKYQLPNNKKTATDKILTEKTFNSGKTNGFNSNSKNQLSKSLFEDKTGAKNSNNIAFYSSNPAFNSNQNTTNNSREIQKSKTIDYSKKDFIASNEKGNSKSNSSTSKIDSVQLAELQNLEKGIAAVTPETKKDKETKSVSNAEKWAVEVFAGIANSQNSKNDKTLGYANDSKQGSTYGVKTKYKITNKWAVGSGLKINELGQSIANVSYINTKTVASLSPKGYYVASESIAPARITNNSNYVFVSNSTTDALKQSDIQSDNLESGNLDQSLKYIEMPLEVSYAVFTRNKASISLNTGGFVGKLISNNVALDGNSIGSNVNANDFVYGSTLSTTLQYRIYKKTNIFAEPAVNYYLNPLNNQSFNQFQWGLNFGLNVSF